MDYRSDVQGLRALAVLVVVLFHARVPGFAGGFIGVDVFFVISGFVIASSLLREIDETGSVSLRRFYGRRVRRLLPAFALMTATVLLLVNAFMAIGDVQETATSTAIAAALSVGNLYLLQAEQSYFSLADELNPFLHTWSLGVEEQFYLVAPALVLLLLWAATRTRWSPRAVIGWGFAGLSGASFVVSSHWVDQVDVRQAFYSPVSRFWEIGIGVALATLPIRRLRLSGLWAALGVVTIAAVVVGYDAETLFPGRAAFPPVVATVALILAAPGSNVATYLLEHPVAVWIGDRSYGWYLWHWPLIVLAGHVWSDSVVVLVGAALVALAPTAISYRYVERPVQRAHGRRRRLMPALGLAAVATLTVGVGSRVAAEHRWWIDGAGILERDGVAYVNGCHNETPWPDESCTFEPAAGSPATQQLLLLGDSHAASAADGVIAAGNRLGYRVVVASGCPLIEGVEFHLGPCLTYWAVVDKLIADPSTAAVIVAHRSTRYVSPPVEAPNGEDQPLRDGHGSPVAEHSEAVALWQDGLRSTKARLDLAGLPLVSIDVVPEFREPFDKSLRLTSQQPAPTSITRPELDARRQNVLDAEHAALEPGHWIDPAESLCDPTQCSVTNAEGEWLYFDDSHLNATGSRHLSGLLIRDLRAILGDASTG